MRDAVAASDTAAITAADSIVRKFALINDSLSHNATADSAAVLKVHQQFKEYAAAMKASSFGMITGSMEDMVGGTTSAKTKYAELTKQLNTELQARNEQINTAFDTATGLQSTSFYSTSAILVVALGALVVLAWGTLTSIIGAMRTLSDTGRDIARGKIDLAVDINSKDEIGELGEAFRGMLSYIGGVAHAADRLATGDLSAKVEVRSEHDVLSRSINGATDTLQGVVSEINVVIDAAKHGDLSKRATPIVPRRVRRTRRRYELHARRGHRADLRGQAGARPRRGQGSLGACEGQLRR